MDAEKPRWWQRWVPSADDAIAVVGFGSLCYGVYLYDPRMAWIAGGAILLAFVAGAGVARSLNRPGSGRE